MGRARKQKYKVVSGVLPSLMRDRGWEKQLDLHSIFPRWSELVDPEVSDHAKPLKIVRGVLWLEVENSSWLQQLQYQKLYLLDVLNQSLRMSRLTDIKMALPVAREERKVQPDRKIRFVRPDAKKIEAFEEQVSCIADEKCRDALMQFWYLSQACKVEEQGDA